MTSTEKSILFACTMNSVRSPMAEALANSSLGVNYKVSSCGVYAGILDPFVARVLDEIDVAIPTRDPQTFADIDMSKLDLVIALTSEAAAEARKLGCTVEFWDTANPTDVRGTDDEVLDAYRLARESLDARIRKAFGLHPKEED